MKNYFSLLVIIITNCFLANAQCPSGGPYPQVDGITCYGENSYVEVAIGNFSNITWSNGHVGNYTSLPAGNHYVIGTHFSGCVDTSFFTVNQPDSFYFDMTITQPTCWYEGGTITIDAVYGGDPGIGGNITYDLDGYTLVQSVSNMPPPTNRAPGSYTFSITDSRGCTFTEIVNISSASSQMSLDFEYEDPCVGDTGVEVILDVSGGVAPYTYLKNTALFDTLPSDTILQEIEYQDWYRIVDANGCIVIEDVYIEESDFNYSLFTSGSCANDSAGYVSISVNNNYDVLWEDGYTNKNRFNIPSGDYAIEMTDGNCTYYDTAHVAEFPLPAFTIATGLPQCHGESGPVSLTNTSNIYAVDWYDIGTWFGSTSHHFPAGDHVIHVKSLDNCIVSDTVTMSQPSPLIIADTLPQSATACVGDSVIIGATLSGGMSPYKYRYVRSGSPGGWSDVYNGTTFNATESGSYFMHFQDSLGCLTSSYLNFQVSFSSVEAVNINQTHDLLYSVTENTDNTQSIVWNTGETGNQITIDSTGVYSFVITNQYGCQDSISKFIEIPFEETTGIANNRETLKASLYPNPTNNYFSINTDEELESISVFTIEGKKIIFKEGLDIPKKIDVAHLSSGIYVIQITTVSGKKGNAQLVKQ